MSPTVSVYLYESLCVCVCEVVCVCMTVVNTSVLHSSRDEQDDNDTFLKALHVQLAGMSMCVLHTNHM